MTYGYVCSILSWLTAYKAYNAFVRVGLVDTDGVRVPVGGAQGWGACGGGDKIRLTMPSASIVIVKAVEVV